MPSKKIPAKSTTPTTDSAFRNSERYWKSRVSNPDLSLALNPNEIIWSNSNSNSNSQGEIGIIGYWLNKGTGEQLECIKLRIRDGILSNDMGKKGWKGKGKEKEVELDEMEYCIIIPSFPGLVLLPSILSPSLQRALTRESLHSALLPNLTSLSAHYDLPLEGIWNTFAAGKGEEIVPRIDGEKEAKMIKGARQKVDYEPVTKDNWKEVGGRGEIIISDRSDEVKLGDLKIEETSTVVVEEKSTIKDLIKKLRWTTIGWSYDWTSKTYDFSKGRTPLPTLIYRTCRDAVRSVPFDLVFSKDVTEEERVEHTNWVDYEPQAGVVNYYQLKDSLTAHIDQSEIDAVKPLISFSIGNSAIFLIGGQTRDTVPIAIILASGDGLIMSGHSGRRNFHGLPRVIADSLPSYLASNSIDETDKDFEEEWKLFGEYLEGGARLNINVRTVF